MSTSYECPYELPEGCGSRCCFVAEFDEDENIVGWKKCCGCKSEDGICSEPVEGLHFFSRADLLASGGLSCTDCSELENAFVSARMQLAIRTNQPSAEFGFVRLQKTDQPDSYDSTALTFVGDSKIFKASGWTISFQRLPPQVQTPGPAIILPPLAPKAPIVRNEKFLTATVVLPEKLGQAQYVVTVLESSVYTQPTKRFALLLTGEWSVLFVREPITENKCDCECKDATPVSPVP